MEKYDASSIVLSSEAENVWNFGSAPELSIKNYQLGRLQDHNKVTDIKLVHQLAVLAFLPFPRK